MVNEPYHSEDRELTIRIIVDSSTPTNSTTKHTPVRGVSETNPAPRDYHTIYRDAKCVYWTTPRLYITRLRLISDSGYPYWDVSYCHGYIGDSPVIVSLPFSRLPKRGFRREIVEYAIADNVHAKRLGILDNVSTLN